MLINSISINLTINFICDFDFNPVLSQRHTMLVSLLDCLRFSKLLKLHKKEDRISSNLLFWVQLY